MSPDRVGRRRFLAASAASLLGACGWDGGGVFETMQQKASRFNDALSEALQSPRRLAPKYGAAERSRVFPAYHISRMTPTLDDPRTWRLEVGGLVREPVRLSLDDIRQMESVRYTVKHHCVEGWSAIATWKGTPFRVIAETVGMTEEARYVRFDSFDSGYYNGWDLKSAFHPETILAYEFNDSPLLPERGAPVRLYAPHKLGYKLTKYLTRISFTAERPGGYWEDQGYPWFGGV
jgi:DMSO/TMAO reductase YedYZ molybdopterin-dependent catalytic subunit